jgi:molybdopterin synthase catalytic subunit
MVELTNEIIDYQALTEQIRSNQAGAVVLFLGTVREMTQGRQTLALDYDAFPEMAIARMKALEAEVRERWPVINVGIIHRLGHLELGDISVAVAVCSQHRELAFEAGKYLIDTLKITVPVWKKGSPRNRRTNVRQLSNEAGDQLTRLIIRTPTFRSFQCPTNSSTALAGFITTCESA